MPLYRDFSSRRELDAEYDVDNTVPEFEAYVQSMLAKSAEARATLTHHLRVPYGPGPDETLDIFPAEPTTDTPAPVLIFFHGGYWRQLTAAEFDFVALGLARAGMTVVIPTHSLCPRVSIDEIVRQARAAVAWTARKCFAFGGDPERLYVGGHSAGGHLAVMTALTDWEGEYGLPADVVKGVVSISGLFDLTPLPFTSVGSSLRLTEDQIRRNSPLLLRIPPSAPPLLLSYGEHESSEFARQSEDLAARWRSARAAASTWAQPGCDHFAAITGLFEAGSELTQRIATFVGTSAAVGV